MLVRDSLSAAGGLALGLALFSEPAHAAQAVVYLNFDGAQMVAPTTAKGDHAARGESELVKRINKKTLNIPAARFPTDSPRDIAIKVLLADVKAHYRGLNIRWVTQRPIDDRYTMVVIGGSSDLLGIEDRELGWGPTDCKNQNDRNVAFVFSETINGPSGQWNSTQIAATISQEVAHAFGLEHVEGPDDLLMRPVPAIVGQYRFGDACHTIVPGPVVGPNDMLGCGDSPGCPKGQQNDKAALTAILGAQVNPGGGTGGGTGAATLPGGSTQGTNPGSTGGAGAGQGGKDKGCSLQGPTDSRGPWSLLGLSLLVGTLRLGSRPRAR